MGTSKRKLGEVCKYDVFILGESNEVEVVATILYMSSEWFC